MLVCGKAMRISRALAASLLISALSLPVLCGTPSPAKALVLPSSPYPVAIDGNPEEAFLLGAVPIPLYDAVSGNRDGSVRAWALAEKDGLYVAEMST